MHPFSIMESGFSADHSLTEHARRTNSLCRLCGERVKRGVKDRNRSKGTLCTQYSDEILSIFGINVVEDTDHKHSSFLCKKCQCRLVNFKNRNNSCEKAVETALDSFEKACGIWPHYDESVSTGQCQPVSVKRSVSTGQCQCSLFPL